MAPLAQRRTIWTREPVTWTRDPLPLLLRKFPTADGRSITLCDFASAGAAGNRYLSWLPVSGVPVQPFSRENPMRTALLVP